MQIPVVVEPISPGQFRAHGPSPLQVVAEGATSDEALAKLREQLGKEIEQGKRIVMMEIPTTEENPWLAIAGSLKDNPLFDEWQAAIDEFRHQCDVDAGIEPRERS